MESLARSYAKKTVCPSKHSGLYARGKNLLKRARETEAKGVVFIFLKFCDPHLFDYPYLRDMLKEEGIPSIMFEIEENFLPDGQFKTRLEAFMEIA